MENPMIQFRLCCLFILLILNLRGFSLSAEENLWECVIQDSENKTWSAKNEYHKKALNLAFEFCIKESNQPQSCKKSKVLCQGYDADPNKPVLSRARVRRVVHGNWQCTAFDRAAIAWHSGIHRNRDAAAWGAQTFCKGRSRVPETCYVNFITCR
jgi:hypothetical protein